MATEEEAREAATDSQEVQVEAAGHLQTQLDSKLSSMKEMKGEVEGEGEVQIIDSTEGMLKIPEDQVLVEPPSEIKIPPEQNLNGMASSLNGHVDKEEKISNEQSHEINQESQQQEETSPDGISTYLSNKSKEYEIIDSHSHAESTSEDSTLLKCENAEPKDHSRQDFEGHVMNGNMEQDKSLKSDNATKQTVGAQQDLESSKGTEDTQPASMENIPDNEVVAEAPAGVQSPLEPNADDSDVLLDTTNGSTETDELAKADDTAFLDHKEGFPEDKDIAEHADKAAKVEDDKDAEVLTEEMPDSKESGVPKTEQVDEASIDDQEALNQEPALETNDGLSVKTEETCHQSNADTCGKRTPEDDATTMENVDDASQENNVLTSENISEQQLQGPESEEIKSAEIFETEVDFNQRHAPPLADTAEEDSTTACETPKTESAVEIKETEDTKTEVTPQESNVSISEEPAPEENVTIEITSSTQEPIARSLESIEDGKDTKTDVSETFHQKEEDVPQMQNQEDSPTTCELHVMESAEVSSVEASSAQATPQNLEPESFQDMKEVEATEPERVCQQSTGSTSEESVPEENYTAKEDAYDSKEIQNDEPEIKEHDDAKYEEISNQSNGAIVEETAQETNLLASEPTNDVQIKELESEQITNTIDVQTERASHQIHDADVEDTCTASEPEMIESSEQTRDTEPTEPEPTLHSNAAIREEIATQDNAENEEGVGFQQLQEQESIGFKETEALEPQGVIPSHNVSISEEFNPQETVTKDERSFDTQADESSVVIIDTKDVKSSSALTEEAAPEKHATEATPDTMPIQEPELEERNNIESVEQEDNIAASDLPGEEMDTKAMETEARRHESTSADAKELSEDVESKVAFAEEAAPEEHILESEVAVDISSGQDPELEEIKNTEGTEQENNCPTSEEFSSQETVTIDEPSSDTQAEESSVVINDTGDVKSTAALTEEANPEEHVLPTETTAGTLPVQEPELEESKNIESAEAEDNIAASDLPGEDMGMKEIETEAIPHESTTPCIKELSEDVKSNVALAEEAAPELEETKNTEGEKQEHNGSTSEEFSSQETITTDEPSSDTQAEESSVIIKDTEDLKNSSALTEAAPEEHVSPTEGTADTLPVQEPELQEIKNTESIEAENNIVASDLPGEDMDIKTIETEAIPHENTTAGINELSEDVKSNVALAEETALQEHILEAEVDGDSSVQEPKVEEIKNTQPAEQEHNIIASGLPEEAMKDNEAMATEVILHDSNVASIKELTEDDIIRASAPDADNQQIPEQESVEDVKCTETTEHPGEIPLRTFSASDKITPTGEQTILMERTFDTQQVQSMTDQETKVSHYVKTEEFSGLSTYSTPEEAAQESDVLKSEPSSEAQKVDSAEETRGTEDVETEDYQKNGVSNFEETMVENNAIEVEPNVDDQHVQEDRSVVEVKENEATETEEISKLINFTISENSAKEISEPGSDQAFYVHPEQQIELTKDGENNQLVEAEETSIQSNIFTLEDPTVEHRVANEIEPSVQEHELELIEIKDTDSTEAEEASRTGQVVSLEEQLLESNELTHDFQQVNELDATEEMKGIEDIRGEEICNQQTGTSEDPSPADNVTAGQDYTVELNKENLGDGIENGISVHGKIKDEIQESAELKDEASELGEKTQSEMGTVEDDDQISSEDIIETSNSINPIKEESKAGTEHSLSQISNAQDKEQLHDVLLQTQVCDRSVDTIIIGQQDETMRNIRLDQQQEEVEGIENQKEPQIDEQKHDDKRDVITDTQVEPIDAFEAEQTDTVITEMLKNEVTQHISSDSIPTIADTMVENIGEIKEETEEEKGTNNVQESSEKDAVMAKTSRNDQDEATGEIRNEQVELCLASSMERDLQADSDLSNDQILENIPVVVPQNDEYSVHTEEKEYTDKVNIDMHAIQESDEVIVDEAEEKQGMQNEEPKVDLSIAETNNDNITNPLPEHETETASDINEKREYQEATNADYVMQLEPEENAIDRTETDFIEKMETTHTEATEVVTFKEDLCDKPSGADGVPTEEAFSLDNTEKEFTSPEKALPSEPEEQGDNQVTEEKDEDERRDPEICDMQKEDQREAEQDYLPVSSFLMNLILGKDSNDPNISSETEAEKKQEDTMTEESCFIASQPEESLVSFPIENMADEELTFEREKENVNGSKETNEPIKEQSCDVKLDIERSQETDEELKRNTHDLEGPVYEDNTQDEISSKLITTEAAVLTEKIEARDFELDEKPSDTVCQESVEAATEIEESQDDTTNPKTSQQGALEEGETELPHESLHEDRSSDEMANQTLSLIEPDIGDATKVPYGDGTVQNPPYTKQKESIESSNVEVRRTTEAQVESEEVEKEGENQHIITGGHAKKQTEHSHDDMWKGTHSEAKSDEQAEQSSEITDQDSQINFAYEKEIHANSACMDKKESDKFSNNEVSNLENALEIHSDSPNLHVNQDKQDESADNQIVMDHNSLLDKPEDSNLQEQRKTDIAQKFSKDTDEGKHKFMAITEPVINEENVHETVKSNMQIVKTKSKEEQEVFDSQVQERGLDVVSPKAAPEVEENYVEVTKPEFNTDEDQSPKADESNIPEENTYSERTKDEEETNNVTNEATVTIEERGTGQKASHKKHNILSGVGSKVKHQLAKVKKAIIGKPGHTKSEPPKS